jgi:hypothetical protein
MNAAVLKEARRAVQVRAVKGVAENQKPQSSGGHSRSRWDVLKAKTSLQGRRRQRPARAAECGQKIRLTIWCETLQPL